MDSKSVSLMPMTIAEIPAVTEVVKECYPGVKEMDKLLYYFNMQQQLSQPDCTFVYKIIKDNACIGVINLAFVGMEALLVRCFACLNPALNVQIFDCLLPLFPQVLSYNVSIAINDNIDDFTYDWDGKKRQFAEDNGFVFYTNSRWNRYIKMLKPHEEVYQSSRYRFGLLDGSMDGVSFRFFGVDKPDFYDGKLTNCRMTDVNFGNAIIYDTWVGNGRFYDSSFDNGDFRYGGFRDSTFTNVNLEGCKFDNCALNGMTIDGVNVEDALSLWAQQKRI